MANRGKIRENVLRRSEIIRNKLGKKPRNCIAEKPKNQKQDDASRAKFEENILRRSDRIRNKRIQSALNKAETGENLPLLHHELIFEILRWLPVKCLIRFKCVCKLWFAVIQERYFIEKHLRMATYTLIYSPDERLNNVHKGEETFFNLTTLHGLLLEKSIHLPRKYRIRNPETRQILDLPDPLDKHLSKISLFYLPIAKKYKLIYPFQMKGTTFGGCKVLTLGEADLRWRILVIPSLNNLSSEEISYAITRADPVFFLFRRGYSEVVCIEMESECFISVKIPETNYFSDSKALQTLRWNDKFSLAKLEDKEGAWKFNLWILKDHRKQKWIEKKIVIPSEFMTKYADTKITLRQVHHCWLLLAMNNDMVELWYDIESKKTMLITAPTGKRLSGIFRPSLVCLEGMRREGKQELDV